MAPVAKKNRKVPAQIAAKDIEESVEDPKKISVVSGQLQKAIRKKKVAKKYKARRGVVFIRHLPHGFFEDQLKSYFQQFGAVTRVRLARSTRTGNSKGFAYVEFAMPEVAQIAAETMDNYLMFRKLVNATYIPPESQQFNYFRTSVRKVQNKFGKSIYVSHATRSANQKVSEFNKSSEEKIAKQAKTTVKKLNKLKRRFADLDVDIDDCVARPGNVENTASSAPESPSPKKQAGQLQKKKSTQPKEIPLKRLLEETIDEEDSSEDDDFQPDVSFDSGTSEKKLLRKPLAKKTTAIKKAQATKSKEISLKHLLEKTIEEDDSSDDDDFRPAETSIDETPEKKSLRQPKTKKANAIKQSQAPKSKGIPIKRLLEETIEEDDSSEDDDFQPDETPEKKSLRLAQTKKANASKQPKTIKTEEIMLKRLLEETIDEDDSSDDDDFQPESPDNKPSNILRLPVKKSKAIENPKKQNPTQSKKNPLKRDSSFASDDRTPQKKKPAKQQPSKKVVNVKQAQEDRLEKIMKRNTLVGRVQKKGKKQQQGKAKSQALQKKIQDTAKIIVQNKKVAQVKGKDLQKKKMRK